MFHTCTNRSYSMDTIVIHAGGSRAQDNPLIAVMIS